MKKFIIICDGGFCNRLNALLAGLVLANELHIKATVIWPKNDMCGLDLNLIFDDFMFDVLDSYTLISKSEWNRSKAIIHIPYIPYLPCSTDYRSFDSLNSAIDFYKAGNSYMGVYANNMIPAFIPQELTLEILTMLKFQKNILERVDEIISKWHAVTIYGIHLRATDYPGAQRIEPIFKFVSDMSDAMFFICSDDEQVEQIFTSLPNVCLNNKKSQCKKKDVEQAWFSQQPDGSYHYNIVRDADVVFDGLVDLLLLSRTRMLCQPDIGSTYWYVALLLNKLWRKGDLFQVENMRPTERLPVYAYAAGSLLTQIVTELDCRYEVVGVVDGDSSRWGQIVHGLTVESPQVLSDLDYPILICTYHLYAAYNYLTSDLGLKNKILFLTHNAFE